MLTRLAVLLTITINIISCTKGDPKISLLKMKFPAPEIEGSSYFNLSTPSQSITISGSCDKRISELQISKDKGTTWSPISSASGDLSCSDKYFSFSISDPGAFLGVTANTSFKHIVWITGLTKFGRTPAAEFIIEYIQTSGPTLSASDVVIQEDVGTAIVTVTLSSALTTPVTFDWSTAAGSAISSLDFTLSSGVGTIAVGATTTTIMIPIVNDSLYENPETFNVSLSNPSIGTILTSQALVTITNDTDVMPTLAIASTTLGEGNSNTTSFPFTITLSTVSGADVIVDYITNNSTAISGSDYVASSGTITIPAGQVSATVNIDVKGDTTFEQDEFFYVTLSGGSGYTISNSTLSGLGTITNDDAAPTISIVSSIFVEGTSGSSNLTFTIAPSVVSTTDIVVNYSTSDVTATAGSDYDFSSGTITIPAGQASATLNIPVAGDTLYESDETFFVNLSGGSGYTVSGSTLVSAGTIINDDATPTISIGSTSIVEGVSASTSLVFTVTSSVVSGLDIVVNYTTSNSTASAESDYTATSGSITIPKGQTTSTITVPINGDTLYEIDETFFVVLSGGSGYATGSSSLTATGTITNDDTAPTITIGDVSFAEGSSGTSNMTFTITASAVSGADVVVNYMASNISATSGSDFTAGSGTATILRGQITGTFSIVLNGDTMHEIDETLLMTLSGGSGYTPSGSDLVATGAITNDDIAPTIAIGDVSVTEGNTGNTNMTFTVAAAAVSGVDIVVNYSTSNGTAVVGTDYSAASGTATIIAGQTTTTFNVVLNGDTTYEADETLTATLSAGSGYTLSGSDLVATGTITNDDFAPTISITNVSQAEGISGSSLTFTISSSEVSDFNITVNYATGDATAIAGSDYSASSGTATIAAGQISTTFNISIFGDTMYETDEAFSVNLNGGSGYTVAGSTLTATGTIMNDDIAPTISITNASVTEGNSGTSNMTFTIMASTVSGADIVVDYATVNGTATSGSDYITISGAATITAGQSSTSFNVSINGDNTIEQNETFTVNLSNGVGYTFTGSTLTATGTILDDDTPVVVPVYAGNSNWNKYVKNDGGTIYTASNTACTGNETGTYRSCIHGGGKRKVVFNGYSSCVNLTIADNNGVFDWFCDDSSGTVTFYSTGLKSGKGLRDLISAGGSWISNYVTIYQNASPIASSIPTAWWTNSLQDLSAPGYNNSAAPSVYNLSTAGTIYFIASDLATYGYQIAADEISIVTLGTSKLTKYGPDANFNCSTTHGGFSNSPGNTVAILCGGTRRFVWIEANMDGVTGATNPAYGGLYAYDWKFSRVDNSIISPTHIGHSFYAVTLNNSHANLINDLKIYSVASGFELKNSTYNMIRTLRVADAKSTNANGRSISIDATSNFNRFYDVQVANHKSTTTGSNAVVIEGSNNVISRMNASNITGSVAGVGGIYLSATAFNNILSQIVSSSTSDTGIKLASADNNIISFYTSANNTWNGIYLDGTETNGNLFNSIAIANTSDPIKSNAAGTYTSSIANTYYNLAISNYANWAIHIQDFSSTFSGYIVAGTTPNCSPSGANLNSSSCGGSGVTVVASEIATAFKGPSTSDSFNGTGTGIRDYFTINTLALWTDFETFYRTWGKSGSGFPSVANEGYCGSSSCQIWDYRVATSSVLHNRSMYGITSNPTFTIGTCAAGINGDQILTANGMTFMQNAIEIDGDGIGNDNSLCESSERCLFAPNIGAYQGEGDFAAGGYCITTGTVNGSKIFKYPITGL